MLCPICRCQLKEESAVECTRCHLAYHLDCWDYIGKCSAYGCSGCESAPFSHKEEKAIIEIDEKTQPPFSLAPYVERLGRRLPFYGRAYLLPTLVGFVATIGTTIHVAYLADFAYVTLPLAGFWGTIVVTIFAQKVRHNPSRFAAAFWACTLLSRLFTQHLGVAFISSIAATLFVLCSIVLQLSLFQVSCTFTALALLPATGQGKRSFYRPFLAALLAHLLLLLLFGSRTPFSFLAFVGALFTGLCVALPLEVAQSALSYRLDQEGKRQGALLSEKENNQH